MVLCGWPRHRLRQERNQVFDGPNVTGNTGFHRWRHPQGLMYPAEVVVHVVESHGVSMVLHFFAESVGQTGKPPHRHPHGEVLPLDIGRTHMGGVRVSNDGFHIRADALGR